MSVGSSLDLAHVGLLPLLHNLEPGWYLEVMMVWRGEGNHPNDDWRAINVF